MIRGVIWASFILNFVPSPLALLLIYAKFVPLNCYATERNLLNITEIQCKDKGYQVSRVNAVHNLKGTQSSILPPATAVKVNILP